MLPKPSRRLMMSLLQRCRMNSTKPTRTILFVWITAKTSPPTARMKTAIPGPARLWTSGRKKTFWSRTSGAPIQRTSKSFQLPDGSTRRPPRNFRPGQTGRLRQERAYPRARTHAGCAQVRPLQIDARHRMQTPPRSSASTAILKRSSTKSSTRKRRRNPGPSGPILRRSAIACGSSPVKRPAKTISETLADKELFIADGHHRYETSLNFRDEMRSQLGRKDGIQPFD